MGVHAKTCRDTILIDEHKWHSMGKLKLGMHLFECLQQIHLKGHMKKNHS